MIASCALGSHQAWLYILIHTLVMVGELVVVRATGTRMEGGDPVEVQNKVLSVTPWCGMA